MKKPSRVLGFSEQIKQLKYLWNSRRHKVMQKYRRYVISVLFAFVAISIIGSFLQSSEPTLVIFLDGQYKGVSNYEKPDSYEGILKLLRWRNSGDLVWSFGATRMLNSSTAKICMENERACKSMAEKHKGRSIVYRPTANLLAEHGTFPARIDTMTHTLVFLRRTKLPILYVGIGTQGQFVREETRRDMDLTGSIEMTANDYNLSKQGLHLLNYIQDSGMPVLMRGEFSVNVTKLNGLSNGINSGCPSLMINRRMDMGSLLAAKYNGLSKKLKDRTAKIGINIKPFLPRLLSLYIFIFEYFPNSVFFIQESNDARVLKEQGIPFERVRAFGSVEKWHEEVCKMDLSLGSRIHGNMVALGCEDPVPVYVIAPDYRVLELAESMKLPHTTIYDRRLFDGIAGITNMLSNIVFDGKKFDESRCQKAKIYSRVFKEQGIALSNHVEELANSC